MGPVGQPGPLALARGEPTHPDEHPEPRQPDRAAGEQQRSADSAE
jgi:hypothetical protein